MNYLLLIKGSFKEWNQLTQSHRDKVIDKFGQFASELGEKGYLRGGDECGEKSFRIMNTKMSDDECAVPTETKDMVTGYFLIEVPSKQEALNIVRKCPAFNCGDYVELVPCGAK